MHTTSKAQIHPLVNPTGETVFELIGRPAEHGGTVQHSLAHIVIAPDSASTRHFHKVSEETYYILRGAALMVVDGRKFELRPGETCLIQPGEAHQISNAGLDDLEFLAVCAPAWAPGDSFEA
jgi:mannose-6-phosphate isomerase-like protein (cupin superfamily)